MQRSKNALIFEREKYLYQQYISDLNGIDTKAHNQDPFIVIRNIRNWLKTASRQNTIPGYGLLQQPYREFVQKLPLIVQAAALDMNNLLFTDYCQIVEEAIRENL